MPVGAASGVQQMVAELAHNQDVMGSNPIPATMLGRYVVKKALWDWGVWDTKKKDWIYRGNLSHKEAFNKAKELNK